eukprot:SAG31_NODE_19244_length_608_cov_1.214145_1_plen_202_part_11
MSSWRDNQVDLLETAYFAYKTDHLSSVFLIGPALFCLVIMIYGYAACQTFLLGFGAFLLLAAIAAYYVITEESFLLATKRTNLDGFDVSYRASARSASDVVKAYVSVIYNLFYNGVAAPQKLKNFTKNVLAWNVVPKGKDTIDIYPGHVEVEQSRQLCGIGPKQSIQYAIPMQNLQWLHFSSSGRSIARLLIGLVLSFMLGI